MATNFQQTMSDPNAPIHINPGVVGEPSAIPGLLGSALELGTEAYKNTQLRNQRLEQDKAINQLENYMEVEALDMDQVSAERNAADAIWKRYEDQEVNIFDTEEGVVDKDAKALNLLEESYGKSVEVLKKAKEQGVLSDSEFLARITKITREAVVKNPWMEAELYSSAQTHLKAMGISDLLDTRAKAAKDMQANAEKEFNRWFNVYKENDMLDKWNPQGNPAEWQAGIIQEERAKFELKSGRRALELGQQFDDATIRRMLDEGNALKFHNNDLQDIIKTTMKDLQANPQNLDQAVASLEQVRDKRMAAFRVSLGTAAYSDKGKAIIADMRTDWDNAITTLTNAGTGKVGTERLKNLLSAVQARQELDLRSTLNVEAVNMATKIVAAFEPAMRDLMFKKGLPAVKSMLGYVSKLMDGENTGAKEAREIVGSGVANSVFEGIISQEKGFADRDGRVALVRSAEAINRQVESGQLDPKLGIPAVNAVLQATAQNAHLLKGQPTDPEFTRQIVKAADLSMGQAVPELMRVINAVATDPKDNIELDVLPNGSFIINTGDPKADAQFNSKFSSVVNNALDAYAAASGKSREQVAPEFYNKYLRIYVGADPDLQAATKPAVQSPAGVIPGTMQISPEMQAERDATRLRVLQMEVDDYKQKLSTADTPEKKKLYQDNIKFVEEELKALKR